MPRLFATQTGFWFGRVLFLAALVSLWVSPGLRSEESDDAQIEEEYFTAIRLLYRGDIESLKKAPRLLKKLAVAGHARSQDALGTLYRQGLGVIQSDKQAVRWFEEAAEQSYPNSMLSLAELYLEGLGVEQDYAKARELLERLLDPEAKYEVRIEDFSQLRRAKARSSYLLGVIHSSGFGVDENMEKAIVLFETAAHSGDQDATMYLAITYAEGTKVEKSVDKAKEYFELLDLQSSDALRRSLDTSNLATGDLTEVENLRESAEVMNEQISQTILEMQTQFAKQVLYSEGEDFDASFAAGLLGLAAEGGYAEAQSELGILYYRGLGLDRNLEEAVRLVSEAATQNWIMAQYNLAVMMKADGLSAGEQFEVGELLEFAANHGLYAAQVFLDGNENPGVLNAEEARDLCLENAELNDPRAQYSLARRKMSGWMVEQEEDRGKLVELFRKSSDSGYSRAQYTMGMLYMSGEVVERNIESGFWWLKRAAEQDHPLALHHIGTCYAGGIGVAPNVEQAFRHFQRSAEFGLDAAKNSLAIFYNTGIHVARNEWKASELYLEAADEGDPTAAFNIGNCYLEGKGVKRNVDKGLEWISRSGEQGNLVACGQMSRIYEEGFLTDFDAVEVAYWQEKAAELGNRNSMKLTALNYFYGNGIPKNRGKSAFWISEYINQSGPMDVSRLTLGGEYEAFDLVQALLPRDYSALVVYGDLLADPGWSGYDPEEAYTVFNELASKGFWGARYRLAALHAHHSFSKASAKKGYSLYKSLYDDNRNADLEVRRVYAARAAYQLFKCTLDGVGVRASESKATKWLELSAEGGHVISQYELGKRLVAGDGANSDFDRGVSWLIGAARRGHVDARGELARLNLDHPIVDLDQDIIVGWLKELVDAGSGDARLLLRRYGIEYKAPATREKRPSDEKERKYDPYAPIEAA